MSVATQILTMFQLRTVPQSADDDGGVVPRLKLNGGAHVTLTEQDRYGVRNATQYEDIANAAATPGVGRTDIQAVATWLAVLRYGDMMRVARGIVGADAKDEDVVSLADKLHAWAEANKVPDA